MHGSPLSKYDNKLLWKYYNYRDFGIIGEPYFDVNFSKVLYLTDTGRRWNGEKVSVRDKVTISEGVIDRVDSPLEPVPNLLREVRGEREKSSRKQLAGSSLQDQYNFHKTFDIIKAIKEGLPEKPALSPPAGRAGLSKGTAKPSLKVIMFTFHPQR